MLKRTLPALACIAALATACSSGGSSGSGTTTTTKPSPYAGYRVRDAKELQALADRVDATMGPICQTMAFNGADATAAAQQRLRSTVKVRAQSTCSSSDQSDSEVLELTLVSSRAAARKYATQRSATLCSQAKQHKVVLRGLRWVIGPNWVIQPDTEAYSRTVAEKLGASYLGIACPGLGGIDWSTAGLQAIAAAGRKLNAAGLGCTSTSAADRDVLASKKYYIQHGLPAALGRCTDQPVEIGTTSARTKPPARVAESELAQSCIAIPTLGTAAGHDLFVVAPADKLGAIARTLDLRVVRTSCPSPATTTTT
ncbi:MAG: hypothetical protein ACXV8Y_00790 [Acidimicrobiia bacterium]